MIGIILTGHGSFASGLYSSLELIAGKQTDIVPVDFKSNDSTEILTTNLHNAIKKLAKCDNILVLTDLIGGSPFKEAILIKMQSTKRMEVLSGTNLGMLLETALKRAYEKDINHLIDTVISSGKKQIIKYEFKKTNDEEITDGI